jgi:hypothetical protein
MAFKVVGLGLLAAAGAMHWYKKRNPGWMSYGGFILSWDVPRDTLIPGAVVGGIVCLILS